MKKFSELVKKLTVVGNDYVPIIDSQAESDADKNKAALFSTILTYLRGETIRNTGTVTDEGMYALDAKQGNPNVSGTLANILSYLSGGTLMGTLDDNTIPTGLYRLNGTSATGTLPDDVSKYGTVLVVNRWNTGYQLLLSSTGVYEREVKSNTLTAAWKEYIPAKDIPNRNVYTTSTSPKIEYDTELVTENGTSSKLIVYPNLKIAILRLSFVFKEVSSGAWRTIATLPVTANTTQNFTGIVGVSPGSSFTNATVFDMTFSQPSGATRGNFNVFFGASGANKRCDVNVILSIN